MNSQLHSLGERIIFIGEARPYAFVQSYESGANPVGYTRLYAFREACDCWLVMRFIQRVDAAELRQADIPQASARKLLALVPRASVNLHRWPCPPAGAKLSHVRGVLTDVALGNGGGGLNLRTPSGMRFFEAGADLTIGGYSGHCIDWETKRCAQWPGAARLGRSLFDVTYWTQPYNKYDDTPTEITNKIDLVRP